MPFWMKHSSLSFFFSSFSPLRVDLLGGKQVTFGSTMIHTMPGLQLIKVCDLFALGARFRRLTSCRYSHREANHGVVSLTRMEE